jgi:hypothetical protein
MPSARAGGLRTRTEPSLSPATSVDTPSVSSARTHATNGAFRDGLFLGTQAAKRGAGLHIASGRRPTDQDRDSFAEGYRRGYAESSAIEASAVNRLRRSELVRDDLAHGENLGEG